MTQGRLVNGGRGAMLALAAASLFVGWGAAAPARADDHAAYYSACVRQSGNKALCTCLADLAMHIDPQLRSDMILSMASPERYRATRAPHVPNNGPEMLAWEKFDVAGQQKCGMDI
jgi:hypothetical protein